MTFWPERRKSKKPVATANPFRATKPPGVPSRNGAVSAQPWVFELFDYQESKNGAGHSDRRTVSSLAPRGAEGDFGFHGFSRTTLPIRSPTKATEAIACLCLCRPVARPRRHAREYRMGTETSSARVAWVEKKHPVARETLGNPLRNPSSPARQRGRDKVDFTAHDPTSPCSADFLCEVLRGLGAPVVLKCASSRVCWNR